MDGIKEGYVFGIAVVVVIVSMGVIFWGSFFDEGGVVDKVSNYFDGGVANSPGDSGGSEDFDKGGFISGQVIGNPASDSGDSSSGSDGGGEGDGGTTGGCGSVSYSIGGLVSIVECEEYDGDVCLDKSVLCSVDVENFDYAIGGDFGVGFYVVEGHSGYENALDSVYVENYIGPRGNSSFAYQFEIVGDNANLDLGCAYKTLLIPKKYSC